MRRALTDRGSDAIHRRIPTADHNDALAFGVQAARVELFDVVAKAFAIRRGQKINRAFDPLRTAAGTN